MIDGHVGPTDGRIGPHNNLADAALGDQVPQRFGGEDQRVEIELPQILGGVFLERGLVAVFRKHQALVIRPVGVGRQVAASMSRAELEAWKTIQCSFENQMRERDGGFEWIADHVGQHAVAF